jgi:antitoxin component YwqK of YwqJK toxin-antitoxin module
MKESNGLKYFLFMVIMGISVLKDFAQEKIIENGYNKIYYPTGKLSSEGLMRNGIPDGYWKTYFPTGIIKSEGNRKNFLLDSIWTFYNEKGDTLQKINYLVGRKNGYTVTFNTNSSEDPINLGKLVAKELYVNDKKEGLSYYFYNNGKLKEIVEYKENKKNGVANEYNLEGNLITIQKYSNGVLTDRQKINRLDDSSLKQGLWQEYFDNGRLKNEKYYKRGDLNGQYKEYDEKGNLILILNYRDGVIYEEMDTTSIDIEIRNEYDKNGRLVFSGSYKRNVPIGIHRFFDSVGNVYNSFIYSEKGIKLSEGILTKEGKKEGPWIYYYEDGKVLAKGRFLNNQESGIWNYYYENGKEEQKGEYKNGKYNNVWTWFYFNGAVKREEEYVNGKEEGQSAEYDTSGNIIANGSYFDGEKEGEWFYKVNDFAEKGDYLGGLRNGKWIAYYPDEKIKYEGNYIQGNPDGLHKFYYNNGKIKEEQYFISGIKEKNWRKYNENGDLVLTITYKNNNEVRINGEKINFEQEDIKLIQ